MIRWGFGHPRLAVAVALAMVSRVVYDLVQHEPDIQIAPGVDRPRFGLDLAGVPALDFLVELARSTACWWYFRGGWALLIAVIVLNLTNLPVMFGDGSAGPLLTSRAILPSIILVQTLLCTAVVWLLARRTPVAWRDRAADEGREPQAYQA